MAEAYDLQLVRYTTPTQRGVVIDHLSATFTTVDGEAAVLQFSTSTLVAGELTGVFYVGVEVRGNTGWVAPFNDLFIVDEGQPDRTDPTGMIQFTGVQYVSDRLANTRILTENNVLGDSTWVNATAGAVLADLMTRYPSGVTRSFTATADSTSSAWPAADRTDHTFGKLASLADVLNALTTGAYCQWRSKGTELQLRVSGTGVDRSTGTGIVLIGAGAESITDRQSYRETASVFYVVSDVDGVPIQKVTRPQLGAGAREAVVTVSGAASASVAVRMATPLIDKAAQPTREVTVTYQAATLPARPLVDFQLGDVLNVNGEGLKLIGVQVTSGEDTSVQLTFGAFFLTLAAKLAARSAQLSLGTVALTGGSGAGIPSGVVQPNADPDEPAGVAVVSNDGKWRATGEPYAAVRIGWPAVTKTVFGAVTNVTQYEVWASTGAGSAVPVATTTTPTADFEWDMTPRMVTVRAFNGSWSAFSTPLEVIPAAPVQVTAGLSLPQLETGYGTVVVSWDGNNVLGSVGAEFSRGFAEYGPSPSGPWTRTGVPFYEEGQVTAIRGTAGDDVYVRFVWQDTLGRDANYSDVAVITVAGVTPEDLDSIPDFFANTAIIEQLRVNVLAVGVISVDMLQPNVGELINIRANEGMVLLTGRVEDIEQGIGLTYRLGPNGAIIGREGDPVTFEFDNDSASFMVNGVAATTWGPAGMDVPRMTADSAVLGNHLFEAPDGATDRTIIRWAGE